MSEPDFLICLQCENPIYEFEYENEKLKSAFCMHCGNDELEMFMTEAEFEES